MRARVVCAAAVLGAALAAGCGSDGDPASPTTTRATTTTTEHLEGPQAYVDSGDYSTGLHMAMITKFDRATRTVTYDVVQFLTGDAARSAYQEDLGEPPDTDYYIRNQSKQLRTAVLRADATFRVNQLGGYQPSEPDKGHVVDVETFAGYFDSEDGFDAYFWISLEDGKAVAIEEQYIP